MSDQGKDYEGWMRLYGSRKIYLNVNRLEEGKYELIVVYKNKIIKKFHFTHK